MKMILSPAKGFQKNTNIDLEKKATCKSLSAKSKDVLNKLKTLSIKEIEDIFQITNSLALKTYQEYANFEKETSYPCIGSYDGLVFRQLQKELYQEKEVDYLIKHVVVLSCLYGVLKPSDKIVPHRLDPTIKLMEDQTINFYKYYQDEFFKQLHLEENEPIFNLASSEYSRLILPFASHHPIVTFDFVRLVKGKENRHSTSVKKARGKMVHEMIMKKIETIEACKSISVDGYVYVSSTTNKNEVILRFEKEE